MLFVTLGSPAVADMAAKNLAGQFDKSHALTCIPLVGASEILETKEEFDGIDNADSTYQPKEHLKGWLTDSQARDQVLMIQGDDVKIEWVHRGTSFENNHTRSVSKIVYGSDALYTFILKPTCDSSTYGALEMDRKVLYLVPIRSNHCNTSWSRCRSLGRTLFQSLASLPSSRRQYD